MRPALAVLLWLTVTGCASVERAFRIVFAIEYTESFREQCEAAAEGEVELTADEALACAEVREEP